MHKILGFIAVALNGMVWLGTFESSRISVRNTRPEIQQALRKQAALDLVEKEKSASTALIDGSNPQPPSVSDEQLLTDNAILSGEISGESQGREYRYSTDIRFWKTGMDSLEPGQWKAQVLLMNMENLHFFTVYKAVPRVQEGVITLALEESDKSQTFTEYSGNDVTVPIKKIVVTIDAQGQIRAGAEDEYGWKWKARMSRLSPESYDAMMGSWAGKFANDVPGKLTLEREGSQVKGNMSYLHSVGTCQGKVKGVMHAGGFLYVVGGSMNAHTACIGNYVIKFKLFENKLVGGYYDYQTQEVAEFNFTR